MYSIGLRISVALLFSAIALPPLAHAEVIRSFDADIQIAPDGSFTVSETIAYDFEDATRHGIFRTIPTDHPQESTSLLKTRYVDIALQNVTIDGGGVPYEVTSGGGEFKVKIGDPDETITGLHTYEITYQVFGGLSYYEDGTTEFYWNVTGSEWDIPIERAVAHVTAPAGALAAEAACYAGAVGATKRCSTETSATSTMFTATSLTPGEGLTVAQALDASFVAKQILERYAFLIFWIIGGIAWFAVLAGMLYRHITANRRNRTVIAQYEPYEDFKPMYTGLLFDGKIDPHDITASIIYLAEQGFFKIKKTDRTAFFLFTVDDYEIELRRPYEEIDTTFGKKVFTLLFNSNAPVGSVVRLSDLRTDRSKQKENYKMLTELKRAAHKDLVARGFYEHSYRKLISISLGTTGTVFVLGVITVLLGGDPVSTILTAVGIVIGTTIALSLAYRRRTRKGYDARNHLRGFKEFLSVTDKERFKFHNAPAKSPEQFMQYLPYAIAFGVEKEWAKVFDDITIPEPEWYESGGHGAFSATNLTNSIGAFSTSFVQSSGSSPASSGGGFSGGGAGGGGGGSW